MVLIANPELSRRVAVLMTTQIIQSLFINDLKIFINNVRENQIFEKLTKKSRRIIIEAEKEIKSKPKPKL